MPNPAQAHLLEGTLQLPDRVPYTIQIGEHTGRRNIENGAGSSEAPDYHFQFANGHLVGVTLHPSANLADVAFLTSSQQAVTGKGFDVVRLLLDEAAAEPHAPKFEAAVLPDLSATTFQPSVDASPADVLRAFASSAKQVTTAIDAQALRYARMILARIPESVREWAENHLIAEGVLATRVKEYGLLGHGGDHLLFSTNYRPGADELYKTGAQFKGAMAELQSAWEGIIDLEVKPDGTRFEIRAKPVAPQLAATNAAITVSELDERA